MRKDTLWAVLFGAASLLSPPKQFVITEAKLGSTLSAGVKNALEYDQAAPNLARMAHMLDGVDLTSIERLGFYVIAPDCQIRAGAFRNLVVLHYMVVAGAKRSQMAAQSIC